MPSAMVLLLLSAATLLCLGAVHGNPFGPHHQHRFHRTNHTQHHDHYDPALAELGAGGQERVRKVSLPSVNGEPTGYQTRPASRRSRKWSTTLHGATTGDKPMGVLWDKDDEQLTDNLHTSESRPRLSQLEQMGEIRDLALEFEGIGRPRRAEGTEKMGIFGFPL